MPGSPLTPALVDTLLDRLATDDGFRAKFMDNPSSAVQSLPGAPPDFEVGPCHGTLASREQIAATRAAIAAQLLTGFAFMPFELTSITGLFVGRGPLDGNST